MMDPALSALAMAKMAVISLLVACGIIANDPQVTVEQGILRGHTMRSRGGRDILAFQGVPYAAPPLGPLRFKAPQEPAPWMGERAAILESEKCYQKHKIIQQLPIGNEDCLYLNVYTPMLKGSQLSVMVWVHGGTFSSGFGDSELHGPELLLDQDIVLVTFNYRVGALGFLSFGTPEAPGNYGLKDQVAALRWVQNNIAKFGGNPDSVTIFGESAGGASIHYLMLSPLARGLFHRAIAQSGSVNNPWALDYGAPQLGYITAQILDCQQNSISEILACLSTKDPLYLLEMASGLQTKLKKHLSVFAPTIEPPGTEGAFLSEDPRAMLARGDIADVPLMAGLMTHEGMLQLSQLGEVTPQQDYCDGQARFVPSDLRLTRGSPQWALAWNAIENFYKSISGGDFVEQYLLLNSDVDFVLGVDDFVRGVASLNRSPVYYYQFSYDGGLGVIKMMSNIQRKGTGHGDELGYMFAPFLPLWALAPPADQLTINRMTKIWTDFAKTGNPTPDDTFCIEWRPVESPPNNPKMANTRYLDIGVNLTMIEENLNGDRIAFWQNLREQNLPPMQRKRRSLLQSLISHRMK